ncbi:AMP-binding domain-containing protein [Rhizoctonia solani AG-1 IA]|uniref:AMP-binding domain-containing protein n=1 Tax=Thanatephorus cucumeris (strain AG1-IA) TaxID=983506 RepID=L8WQY2_THACA|nr:AMP-binding domain-containing protein [Rhizoctonia solani AG-1 IA]
MGGIQGLSLGKWPLENRFALVRAPEPLSYLGKLYRMATDHADFLKESSTLIQPSEHNARVETKIMLTSTIDGVMRLPALSMPFVGGQIVIQLEDLQFVFDTRFNFISYLYLELLKHTSAAEIPITIWEGKDDVDESVIPIGHPLKDYMCYVLDPDTNTPAPPSKDGILIVVESGVFGPELDSKEFISDPGRILLNVRVCTTRAPAKFKACESRQQCINSEAV